MPEINFELLEHQAEFVNREDRFLLNSGGVGSGKTYSLVLKALKILIQKPGIFGLLGAATFPQLRDTTLREWNGLIQGSGLIAKHNKVENRYTLINGSEVIFRPLDDEMKLRSLSLGFAGVEELTGVKETVWKQLRFRIGRQRGFPGGQLFAATNPGSFTSYVYRDFIDTPIRGSGIVYSTSYDNEFLPQEYLDDLQEIERTNPEYARRMILGMWGALEGLIYNLPSKRRIDPSEVPGLETFDRFVAGVDFGFGHPTGIIVLGKRGSDWYALEEVYKRKMTSSEIASECLRLKEKYDIGVFFCDSARPEIIEDLVREGVPARGAIKDVFSGIMHVKSFVESGDRQAGYLYVSTDCTYTLREFDAYIWDPNVPDKPIKANDDALDALRYGIFTDAKTGSQEFSSRRFF